VETTETLLSKSHQLRTSNTVRRKKTKWGSVMADQRQSWRHHYVPRFYLKRWTVNEQLTQYRRVPYTGRVESRQVSTRRTGFARRLYSLEQEPHTSIDPDGLEMRLRDVEDEAAPVLEQMVGNVTANLSADEKRARSRFVLLQLDRDPGRVNEALQLAKELRAEVLSEAAFAMRCSKAAELFTIEMARNMARGNLVRPCESKSSWEETLMRWSWHCVVSPAWFVTTDQPIILNVSGVKFGTPASMFSMALSPDRLLVCTPPSWLSELGDDWFELMAVTHNARLVLLGPRFVYSSTPMTEIPGPRLNALLEQHLMKHET